MSDDTDSAQSQQRGLVPWQPGQSGNPAGRPKGSRNKLGEAFIEALHESFNEHGADAIQRVIDEKPDQYLKVIASLCPKEMTLNVNSEVEMSDDELRERIRKLADSIGPFLAAGAGAADSGTQAQAGATKPSQLH